MPLAGTAARIWDAKTARQIVILRGHDNKVYTAAFSPNGTRIVTASWDNTARIWDSKSGREICCLKFQAFAMVAVSRDAAEVATNVAALGRPRRA
ncbi:MAG TPA: hypothetical protein VMF67_09040 [Rhizomicrobium sp.]|nr:hypothetical protein [Rhizomicrobium sp.]